MDPPLGWSSLLLLWLSVVGEVTRFGHNSATVCILIHRRVSAELWKSSPNSSFTWNQNHCRSSILDVNRTSQGWFWSQIAMLGTRFHVRDAFLIQEICKQKLTCWMTKMTKARSQKVCWLQKQVHKPTTTKPWRNCRISISETQTRLQALCLFSAYNTVQTTAQWVHTIPVACCAP